MDEIESFFSKPKLPPKRKPAIAENADDSIESPIQQIDKKASTQDNFSPEKNELDAELLSEFAQLKESGSEVVIDLSTHSKESSVTAPVLEDYIDPHTIPINYLLEQARAQVNPKDDIEKDA